MTDADLDREWKPSNRPQSTMAKSFSLALNDLFKIDNSLADLDAAVSEKKYKVHNQTSELEALEARLKATEERLKAAAQTSPSNRTGRSSPRSRPALGDTFTNPQSPSQPQTSPLSAEFSRPRTAKSEARPTSGWQQRQGDGREAPPMPGALPPTPGASEGEYDPAYTHEFPHPSSALDPEPGYVFVELMRNRADFSAAEDGDATESKKIADDSE